MIAEELGFSAKVDVEKSFDIYPEYIPSLTTPGAGLSLTSVLAQTAAERP